MKTIAGCSPAVYTVVHAKCTLTENNTFCTYLTRFLKSLSVSTVDDINLKQKHISCKYV